MKYRKIKVGKNINSLPIVGELVVSSNNSCLSIRTKSKSNLLGVENYNSNRINLDRDKRMRK